MSILTEYPNVARTFFPEYATDILHYRHKDWFEKHFYVSKADVETQRQRGKLQIPARNREGRRLSAIHENLKTQKAADAYARKHGWPFTIHLGNIDGGAYFLE